MEDEETKLCQCQLRSPSYNNWPYGLCKKKNAQLVIPNLSKVILLFFVHNI